MATLDEDLALERLVEVLLLEREPDPVLHRLASIVGEALSVDRALIYRVSWAKGEATALGEWLNPQVPGIEPTAATYPLSAFGGAALALGAPGRSLESRRSAPHPLLVESGGAKLLHEDMAIASLLWYAFGHDPQEFLVLALNQVTRDRAWRGDELRFLRRASRLVELGLQHLDLQRRQETSEARYRTLFDQSPTMFFVIDEALRVREVNASAVVALGFGAEEVVGQPVLDVFHPEDRADVARHLAQCFSAPGVVRSWEGRKVRKDGAVMWVREVARAIGSDPVLAFVVCDDVTEVRRMEQALFQAQKTESLGLLAGGVAHDFGNVLTAIEGNAEVALTKLPPGSPAAGHVELVLVASERAAGLVRQLMAYAGKASFSRRQVHLDRIVGDAVALVRGSLGAHVVLTLALAPDLPPVDGDVTQLEQVLVNLLLNASTALGARGGSIVVRTHASDDHVVLEVADDGPGMDEATLARMFEPFFSTRGAGHGLGLAASAALVKAHGGRITVRSAPGCGATFTVELPASAVVRSPGGAARAPDARGAPPT